MSNKRSSSRSPFQKRRAIRRRASMPGLTSLASPEASPPESPISVVLSLAPPSLRRASTNGAPQGLLSNGVDKTQHDRCSLCGTRLYKMPSSALFWKRSEKRQIHGRGESSRCFTCEHEGEEALLPFPRLQRQANIRNIESLLNLHENEKIPPSSSEAATATTFSYVGDYNIYGQRHGHGEMIWENGDRFVGNFFNGLRDGHGCLFLSDGSEYVGEWELNEIHGHGTRHFTNNDVYVGHYERGSRSGQGKMHFANGDLYAGTWKNDLFDGFGRYFVHATGQALEGHFVQGKKEGKFKLQHSDQTLDIFKFDNDIIVGNGVRWSANRDKTWLLANAHGKQWSQKMHKKRIPIAEAVSIGYECEVEEPIEPIPLSTLALETTSLSRPQRNDRTLA